MKPHATHFNSVYIHNQNQSTGFKNNKQGILLNRAPEFEQENQFNKMGLGDAAAVSPQGGSGLHYRQ